MAPKDAISPSLQMDVANGANDWNPNWVHLLHAHCHLIGIVRSTIRDIREHPLMPMASIAQINYQSAPFSNSKPRFLFKTMHSLEI